MQAAEGLARRAYDTGTMYKGSFDLREGEEPRKQEDFPAPGDPCPKCGRFDLTVNRGNYFSCSCGLHLYNPDAVVAVMPITPEMKRQPRRGGKPTTDLACSHCGKSFRKLATTESDLCQRCRANEANYAWRKKNPEKYKAILKKCDDRRALRRQSGSLAEVT